MNYKTDRAALSNPVDSLRCEWGSSGCSTKAPLSGICAATIYALGKTFFWPTMLGVAAERFPKGGALTLNAIGGMGMLSVGVIGAVFL